MAMEDAVCLSHEMAARVQLMSRAMGDHGHHPAGAHAALRNQVMSAKTNAEWYETLAWIHGGTGLGEERSG